MSQPEAAVNTECTVKDVIKKIANKRFPNCVATIEVKRDFGKDDNVIFRITIGLLGDGRRTGEELLEFFTDIASEVDIKDEFTLVSVVSQDEVPLLVTD